VLNWGVDCHAHAELVDEVAGHDRTRVVAPERLQHGHTVILTESDSNDSKIRM
jgi:hypothetical protein